MVNAGVFMGLVAYETNAFKLSRKARRLRSGRLTSLLALEGTATSGYFLASTTGTVLILVRQ
jgi:hypothetical protein